MKKKKIDIETAACMAFESLRNQLNHEVKEELEKWYRFRLGFAIAIIFVLGGGSVWGIMGLRNSIIRGVEEDLYRKVEKTYDDKNISILVDELIEEKAGDVIRMQASMRIDSIIESEIRPVIIIHDLALRAGQGYKTAYFKLDSIANMSSHEYAELSRDIVSEIHGSLIYYSPLATYSNMISNKGVVDRLRNKYVNVRQLAVSTIGERKMYNQIPDLIAMLDIEQNLYVQAAITHVLNQFFNSNVGIFDSDSRHQFTQLWRNMQSELIEKN